MKHRRLKVCANCGAESPRNYHCISCNSVAREFHHRFIFRVGWRRPTWEETKGVPLHERELIKEPVEPPFEER